MPRKMTGLEGRGGGRQLRCCDRWRESFDKEQRGAEVSKIMEEGEQQKKS